MDGSLKTWFENSTDAVLGQHSQAILNRLCIAQSSDYDNFDSPSSCEEASGFLDATLNATSRNTDEQLRSGGLREGSLAKTFCLKKNDEWGPIATVRKQKRKYNFLNRNASPRRESTMRKSWRAECSSLNKTVLRQKSCCETRKCFQHANSDWLMKSVRALVILTESNLGELSIFKSLHQVAIFTMTGSWCVACF